MQPAGLHQQKLAYSVEELATLTGLGRTKLFEEIAGGRLTSYRVGRRRFVSAEAVAAWQRALEAETAQQREAA